MLSKRLILEKPLSLQNLSIICLRSYSSNKSLLSLAIGKVNKFIYGSETPYVKPDHVYEQMIKDERYRPMYRPLAKLLYLREKSHERYIKHNVRIRKLEDKITNGAYNVKSFTNKF